MIQIESLLNEFCPKGVEFKTIESISIKIVSGGTPKTNNMSYYGGNIPWLRTQEVNFSEITDTSMYITEEGLKNSSAKWIPENCVIVAMYGATAGKVAVNKIPLTTNQACCNIQLNEKMALYKYVYYCLSNMYGYIKSLGQGSQDNISLKTIKRLVIPVPPLPVQEEIVRILDKFTELTAELTTELTTELTARRKQYEYYRDKLLRFDSNISFKRLGDFSVIKTGKKPKIIETEKTKYEYINAGTSNSGYANEYNCEGDVVTTPSRGQGGIGFVGYQSNAFWLGPLCYKICSTDNKVLNKYLYYFLSSNNYLILANKKEGGTPAINSTDLSSICIPIPSFEEQQRIVDILDRFDKLCNDISEGLPAEIEARQKQYEYYRDKLLTFKPLEEVK